MNAEAWKTMWLSLSAFLSVGAAAWATAYAQARIGAAGAGAMAEKPELAGVLVLLIAIPDTIVVMGFVVGIMLALKAGG